MVSIPSLDPTKTILAHMSKDEIKDLSRAQGGFEINEYLNIPQFYRLGQVLEIPKVRHAIQTAYRGYKKTPTSDRKRIRDGIDDLSEKDTGKELPLPVNENNSSTEIKQLAENGVQGDTQIVALSQPVYDFFKETLGHVDKNPHDQLPQFGLGSFLCSLIGGVIGTFIAPGIGSAIGSGLGNLGGSYLDDLIDPENPDADKSFSERLPSALMSGALGYLGGKGYEGFKSSGLKGGLDALGGSAKEYSPYLIYGGQFAGLTDEEYRKKKDQKRNSEDYSDYSYKRNKALQDYEDQFTGKRDFRTGQLLREKESGVPSMRFAEGGKVEEKIRRIKNTKNSSYIDGHEGGQEDNIHTEVPEGTYIIDATSVAHQGDGNSHSGARKISKFLDKLDKFKNSNKEPNKVKVAIAAGEYRIAPQDVTSIGKGDISNGHKILDEYVKSLRVDKQHSPETIPKKAKTIEEYIGRIL